MRLVRAFAAAALLACAASLAFAQSSGGSPASNNNAAAHAENAGAQPSGDGSGEMDAHGGIDSYPKLSFDTLFNAELAGFSPRQGDPRGPGPSLRFDSTALYEVNDKLSIDALFQFKPRQPLGADDPNNQLFIVDKGGLAP